MERADLDGNALGVDAEAQIDVILEAAVPLEPLPMPLQPILRRRG